MKPWTKENINLQALLTEDNELSGGKIAKFLLKLDKEDADTVIRIYLTGLASGFHASTCLLADVDLPEETRDLVCEQNIFNMGFVCDRLMKQSVCRSCLAGAPHEDEDDESPGAN